MPAAPRPLSRRGVVLGAGALLLSGCAVPAASPTPTVFAGTADRTPTPTPTPTAQLPSRDAIVARFGGRKPTQWGMAVTGMVSRTAGPAVALTLDACGGPGGSGVDTELIDFLVAERIPATLFLNQRWIQTNRAVFDRLAAAQDLFTIGNHGTRHAPLSVTGATAYKEKGTADAGEVYEEVAGNHLFLTDLLGRPPRFFRTGTAWYDEVAVEIVRAMGEIPIGFDINGDAGTTFPKATIVSETKKAKPGSIIIAHFNQPQHATFEGLSVALPALRAAGRTFAKLDDLTVA